MARSSELPSSRAASWTSFGSTTITDYGWPNSAFTCLSRRRVAPSAGDRRSGLLPASGAVGLLFSVILLSGVQPINGGEAGPAFLPETRHDFGIVRQGAEGMRSEEHTAELPSPFNLVCRLLLEKKKQQMTSSVSARHFVTSVKRI